MKIIKNLLPLVVGFNFCAAFSQSPGGVTSGLQLWVKSDQGTTISGGDFLDSWTYVNDGSKSYTSFGTDRPSLVSNVINFKPSVRFTGGIKFMDGPTGTDAPIPAGDDEYSVIVVWLSNSVTSFQRVFSQRSGTGFSNDAFSLSTWDNGLYGPEFAVSPWYHTQIRSYAASTWNISQSNLLDAATSDLELFDDRNISSGGLILDTDIETSNGAGRRDVSTLYHRIGEIVPPDNGQNLNGDIAEIIVYDRSISGTERNQIFSYLALKYGVTLHIDLLSSTPTTVWNATANSSYDNAVFGLGRDDASGLSITQSNSILTGSGDGTGQSGAGNIVLSNPSSLDNGDYLVIGNDNGSLTEEIAAADVPSVASGSNRLPREWKVQHTGNVGTISLAIDLNGISLAETGTVANIRLMVDEDGDGEFNDGDGVRFYVPSSVTGGIATFENIVLNDGEVFTLITFLQGVILPVTWVDFNAKQIQKDVRLTWKVDHNASASHYEIEFSSDGINFTRIGEVQNNPETKVYEFIHPKVLKGTNFYRIRQFDLDGKATLSTTVSLKVDSPDFVVQLINSPVRNNRNAELLINSLKSGKSTIEILTVNGVLLSTKQAVINPGSNRVSLGSMANVQAGYYFVRITMDDHSIQTIPLLKQ